MAIAAGTPIEAVTALVDEGAVDMVGAQASSGCLLLASLLFVGLFGFWDA